LKRLSNQCHRALGFLQYLIIGDPQNPDTERVDELGSFSVLFDPLIPLDTQHLPEGVLSFRRFATILAR